MITSEALNKANKAMKTLDVKGKPYVEVNERIKAFREMCPSGRITTEILSMENGVVTMKTIVYDEDGRVLGSGLAQEKETSSYINKTSYIENCETSAVGRALGMCGIGIDGSVASAEEVANAIVNQQPKPKKKARPVSKAREELVMYCRSNEIDMNEIAKKYSLSATSSDDDFKKALNALLDEELGEEE